LSYKPGKNNFILHSLTMMPKNVSTRGLFFDY
jgi:hypothetical protein